MTRIGRIAYAVSGAIEVNVLIGCECSGIIRDEFERRGHNAWSCDLKPSERPGKHIQGNLLDHLDGCFPGHGHLPQPWHLLIAHPDCTFLTGSAEWAYKDPDYARYPEHGYHMKLKPDTLVGEARRDARERAIDFFLHLWDCGIEHIGLENPTVGRVGPRMPRADQRIQPYQFGDDASKGTCLWLRNLPPLRPTLYIPPRIVNGKPRWANQTDGGQNRLSPGPTRPIDRARTYCGIARAMAEQWGGLGAY